jgi:hypothetical protein
MEVFVTMNKSLKHFTVKGLVDLLKNGDMTPEEEKVIFEALKIVKSQVSRVKEIA